MVIVNFEWANQNDRYDMTALEYIYDKCQWGQMMHELSDDISTKLYLTPESWKSPKNYKHKHVNKLCCYQTLITTHANHLSLEIFNSQNMPIKTN